MLCLLKATVWQFMVWFWRLCLLVYKAEGRGREVSAWCGSGVYGYCYNVAWEGGFVLLHLLLPSPFPIISIYNMPEFFLSKFAVLIKILWALIGYNEHSLNSGKCQDWCVELNRPRFWRRAQRWEDTGNTTFSTRTEIQTLPSFFALQALG